jgi:hypothetical protein
MTHPVLEYLKTHGELPAVKIFVPDMTLGAIKNTLRKYYLEGVLLRREVVMDGYKEKLCMTYSLSGETPKARVRTPQPICKRLQASALKNEPDYAYYLRNLPRKKNAIRNP